MRFFVQLVNFWDKMFSNHLLRKKNSSNNKFLKKGVSLITKVVLVVKNFLHTYKICM